MILQLFLRLSMLIFAEGFLAAFMKARQEEHDEKAVRK
jgi:hypothetical protein